MESTKNQISNPGTKPGEKVQQDIEKSVTGQQQSTTGANAVEIPKVANQFKNMR